MVSFLFIIEKVRLIIFCGFCAHILNLMLWLADQMLYATTTKWTWSLSQSWCFAPWHQGVKSSDWPWWQSKDWWFWVSNLFPPPSEAASDESGCNVMVPTAWTFAWRYRLWNCCGFVEYRLHSCRIICWEAYHAGKNRGTLSNVFLDMKKHASALHVN